jgi:hypothetical protein
VKRRLRFQLVFVLLLGTFTEIAQSAGKIHVISFGRWMTVQWTGGTGTEGKVPVMKIRALMVDGRVKEYVQGASHEVTERLFVVRRVFRVNDGLPDDSAPRWEWQRGGWLLVDRVTGRISAINLPEFDPLYSVASWYRDYAAYCGVADDGKKTYAVVSQLGRRKPVLKKALPEGVAENAAPDSACPAPVWQRGPVRVSFQGASGARETFAIRGHIVDVVNDAEEEDE